MILRVLSDEQLAKLHAVSLDILAEVGVRVPHDEMLARLADAGARVRKGRG